LKLIIFGLISNLAASLVALQSIPGLAVLYAGWVKHKWAVNSAFMVFYAFGAVLVCWMIYAYKAAFGKHMLPFVGKLARVADEVFTQMC
jgi:ammonium transporter, Amt family